MLKYFWANSVVHVSMNSVIFYSLAAARQPSEILRGEPASCLWIILGDPVDVHCPHSTLHASRSTLRPCIYHTVSLTEAATPGTIMPLIHTTSQFHKRHSTFTPPHQWWCGCGLETGRNATKFILHLQFQNGVLLRNAVASSSTISTNSSLSRLQIHCHIQDGSTFRAVIVINIHCNRSIDSQSAVIFTWRGSSVVRC